jgi:glycyl-tRNA synthetase alpha subunit
VSVTERVGIIARIRNLTVGVAKAYAAQAAPAPPELAAQIVAASLEELAR